MTHRVCALVAALLLFSTGCGKLVTEDDCTKIGARMREIYVSDALRKATPQAAAERDKIQAEAEKMTSDWLAECRQEMLGKRVDAKELECMQAAPSFDDFKKCGPH